jgi:uncharacterized membrane-anchored protein YjiN (DUF445 family)
MHEKRTNKEMEHKTNFLAGTSLAVMGAGFLATMPFPSTFTGGLLQGGFEAGLVGGLADWFAVTALFRHPLGLPIPHTALLRKKRKTLTDNLVSVIENEWLNKESINHKLQQFNFMDRILPLLRNELPTIVKSRGMVEFAEALVQQIPLVPLSLLFEREIKAYLSNVKLDNLLHKLIDSLLIRSYDEEILDFLLRKGKDWAEREETKTRLGSMALGALGNLQLDGFMQFALKSLTNLVNEEKLGEILSNVILHVVNDLLDHQSEKRKALKQFIRNQLEGLKTNVQVHKRLREWLDSMLSELTFSESILHMLIPLHQRVLDLLTDDTFVEEKVIPFLHHSLDKMEANPMIQTKVEPWIKDKLTHLINSNHQIIGHLVRENLNKLDDEKLTELIETKIGKDIQWIRVNGAVCGFLIGLLLTSLRLIFNH